MLNRLICGLLVFLGVFVSIPPVHGCPSYTHKNVTLGNPQALPQGYFVFAVFNTGGLYISEFYPYQHSLIPNTRSDHPRSVQISDDGTWVVYLDRLSGKVFVIRIDGEGKTEIPIPAQPGGTSRGTHTVGFVRHSHLGDELFYLYNEHTLVGLTLELSAAGATVTGERNLARMNPSDNIMFDWGEGVRIEVCRNRIFSQMKPIGRNEFVTIPNEGRGVAGAHDIYRWANDNKAMLWGCGQALTPDGDRAVSNSSQVGDPACVPNAKNNLDHKGFYITPFLENGVSPSMTVHEQVDRYGVSINWVPPDYRFGKWDEVNFDRWAFAPNNADYLIGSQFGSLSPVRAIWLIHWSTNTWYCLTGMDAQAHRDFPAMYFGELTAALNPVDTLVTDPDTLPASNPRGYAIVSPNGAEVFEVGQTMTITVGSQLNGNADLRLVIDGEPVGIPGITESFDPKVATTHTFVIPESFSTVRWDPQSSSFQPVQLSAVSDRCRIRLFDYNDNTIVVESQNDFSIIPSSASVLSPLHHRGAPAGRTRVIAGTGNLASGYRWYDCTGRVTPLAGGRHPARAVGVRFGVAQDPAITP